jgi:hypothetical protein
MLFLKLLSQVQIKICGGTDRGMAKSRRNRLEIDTGFETVSDGLKIRTFDGLKFPTP